MILPKNPRRKRPTITQEVRSSATETSTQHLTNAISLGKSLDGSRQFLYNIKAFSEVSIISFVCVYQPLPSWVCPCISCVDFFLFLSCDESTLGDLSVKKKSKKKKSRRLRM